MCGVMAFLKEQQCMRLSIRILHAHANNNGKKIMRTFRAVKIVMAFKAGTIIQAITELITGGLIQIPTKWPVEWVANWPIIPQSASTRGQNRPPAPSLGGGGALNCFSGYRQGDSTLQW
jgi:hypothetical protein